MMTLSFLSDVPVCACGGVWCWVGRNGHRSGQGRRRLLSAEVGASHLAGFISSEVYLWEVAAWKPQNSNVNFVYVQAVGVEAYLVHPAGSYAQGLRKHILRYTVLHSASSESPLPRYSNKAGMRGAPTKQHGPKTGLYLEVSFNPVCVRTCMCACVCIYMCLWVSVSMYMHVFICICVCMYACACICGCVHVCAYICNCMWVCTCVGWVYTCVHVFLGMCVCMWCVHMLVGVMYVHIHVYVGVYIRVGLMCTCIHVCMCMHAHVCIHAKTRGEHWVLLLLSTLFLNPGLSLVSEFPGSAYLNLLVLVAETWTASHTLTSFHISMSIITFCEISNREI